MKTYLTSSVKNILMCKTKFENLNLFFSTCSTPTPYIHSKFPTDWEQTENIPTKLIIHWQGIDIWWIRWIASMWSFLLCWNFCEVDCYVCGNKRITFKLFSTIINFNTLGNLWIHKSKIGWKSLQPQNIILISLLIGHQESFHTQKIGQLFM